MQALSWAGSSCVTERSIGYTEEIFAEVQDRLDEFQAPNGVSMLVDFWNRLTSDGTADEIVETVKDDVQLLYTGEDTRILLEHGRGADLPVIEDPLYAFESSPEYEETFILPWPWVESSSYYGLIRAHFRGLMREAENSARIAAEIPRVGEGWVSEVELLNKMKAAFPDERVVHQARPFWLKPKSLNIYLPDHNVAIEYQGNQHSKPVEYFGGEEAFQRQQDRDAEKRFLCIENGCALIEVHPGYRLPDVITQVTDAIEKSSNSRS